MSEKIGRGKKIIITLEQKHIDILSQQKKSMPDFRKLGMGLQGQLDEINANRIEDLKGTKNSSNKTFTVTKVPKYITHNGQTLYSGNGYSINGLTITLDNAPFASDVLKSHF